MLAGGNAKGLAPVPAKGLVPIIGRPIYEYVVEALLRCADINRVCVVMPVEVQGPHFDERVVFEVASGSLPQVAKAGFDRLEAGAPVLLLSADIPLITPEAISDFLKRCAKHGADVCYPIVRYGEPERRFPGVKRTYVRLREGRFTGGNIILMNPVVVLANMELMEDIYEARKSPFKLFQMLGFGFLLKFILGMLTIDQVAGRIAQILRASCAAVETPHIEIGIDVDKESDLRLAEEVLSGGSDE